MPAPSDKKTDLKKEIEKSAKLFDVAKPGKTPASATSRPIIVGHSPMIKRDPMVREAGSDAAVTADDDERPNEEKLAQHKAQKIEPLKEDEALPEPDAPEAAPEQEPEPEQKAEPEPEPAPETDPEPEPDAPDEGKNSANAAVESLANEVTAKREDQKQKEALEAKNAEIEESISKKEFFVPIGQESRRRSNNRIVLGLVLLIVVALATFNFAADAEMIDIGIEPFTDML